MRDYKQGCLDLHIDQLLGLYTMNVLYVEFLFHLLMIVKMVLLDFLVQVKHEVVQVKREGL